MKATDIALELMRHLHPDVQIDISSYDWWGARDDRPPRFFLGWTSTSAHSVGRVFYDMKRVPVTKRELSVGLDLIGPQFAIDVLDHTARSKGYAVFKYQEDWYFDTIEQARIHGIEE